MIDVKFKCAHEDMIFIEEYCVKNSVSLDRFLGICIELIKAVDTEPEKKTKKKVSV